jgi:iron complex outermembrane recepter protein
MKKSIITVILIMTMVCLVFAQDENTTLTGTVKDTETGSSLSGAHVQIENTFYKTITNAEGRFHFNQMKPGTFSLKVSYLGYKTISEQIIIPQKSELEILLDPEPIRTEEVIISATRADERTPSTQQTMSGNTIRQNAFGQDLPLLLELTPSMVTTSDAGAGIGYTGLRIRGTDISRINVTINGVPLNDPESHSVYWVNLPDLAASIDNIQIQRGVGTSANGAAAFGGSINIQTTKLVSEPFAELNSNFGSFNSFSNTLQFGTGLLNGGWAFDGRLSRITSDGYIDRAFSHLESFFINIGHYGEKNIFRLTMMGGDEKTYQAWEGVPKDSLATNRTYNPYTYENETDNYSQQHFHLNFMRQQNRKISFNATAFLITGKGYYEQFKENRRLTSYGLQPVIIGGDTIKRTDIIQQKHLDNVFYGLNLATYYNSMKKLKIAAGGSLNRYTNDHFGKLIWMQYAADISKDFQWYFNNGIKTDISAFLRSNYLLTEQLSIFADALFRHISYSIQGNHDDLRDLTQSHTYDFLNPKGGVFYVLNSRHECYASVAVAKREPSRNNFRDADVNTIVKPELLIDYEAGYHLKMKNILLSANVYFMDYKDQLVMTGKINNVGDPVMVNVPESYRTGIELIFSSRLSKQLELDANVSLSRNRIRNFTEWVDNWDTGTQISNFLGETDISFSPAVVSGAELRYSPFQSVHFALTSKYVSRQNIDNTSSEDRMLKPWHVNNLRLAVDLPSGFVKKAQLRFSVINVFNVMYESNAWVYRYYDDGSENLIDGYFPQAGRHFMAGLNVKF